MLVHVPESTEAKPRTEASRLRGVVGGRNGRDKKGDGMVQTSVCLGVGIYSIPEAARLLRTKPGAVRRWLDDERPVVKRLFDPSEATISFLELMELHFIKMFRSEGISLQTIRRAAAAASQKFHTDYPFAVRRFDTDGRSIFATLAREAELKRADAVLVEDLRRGQYVFDQIMRPFFRKLEYGDRDEVRRFWPMEPKGRIVLDPERKFGKPIDAETGVPTKSIYDAVMAGGGQDYQTVAEWLDVPVPAVQCAVRFEESLAP